MHRDIFDLGVPLECIDELTPLIHSLVSVYCVDTNIMCHDVIVIYQVAWGWTAGTSGGTQSGPAL